jgi:hypothetical protein
MRLFRVLLAVLSAVTLTACLNSTTLIKVKPDGSGTVEQTTLMNMAALKAMMPGAAQGAGPMSEANLKQTAERMGKGVRLVSTEPAKANGFEGVKAVFAFDDINQIQVSQDPSMAGPSGGSMAAERKAEDPVRFKLVRQGATSMLTINFADKPGSGAAKPDASAPGTPDMADPMIMNMVKSMFQGFKIDVALEVVGTIVKTNAEYVTGPRMTLIEIDMNALLADEAKFKALQSKLGPDASLTALKPYLKDIKGIKIDGPAISVEFK